MSISQTPPPPPSGDSCDPPPPRAQANFPHALRTSPPPFPDEGQGGGEVVGEAIRAHGGRAQGGGHLNHVVVRVGQVGGVVAVADVQVLQADVRALGVHPHAVASVAEGHGGDGDPRAAVQAHGPHVVLHVPGVGVPHRHRLQRRAADVQRGVVRAPDVLDEDRGVVPRQQQEGVARAHVRQRGGHVAEGVRARPGLAVGVRGAVDEHDPGEAKGEAQQPRRAGALQGPAGAAGRGKHTAVGGQGRRGWGGRVGLGMQGLKRKAFPGMH